jgi:hypothetical protein
MSFAFPYIWIAFIVFEWVKKEADAEAALLSRLEATLFKVEKEIQSQAVSVKPDEIFILWRAVEKQWAKRSSLLSGLPEMAERKNLVTAQEATGSLLELDSLIKDLLVYQRTSRTQILEKKNALLRRANILRVQAMTLFPQGFPSLTQEYFQDLVREAQIVPLKLITYFRTLTWEFTVAFQHGVPGMIDFTKFLVTLLLRAIFLPVIFFFIIKQAFNALIRFRIELSKIVKMNTKTGKMVIFLQGIETYLLWCLMYIAIIGAETYF